MHKVKVVMLFLQLFVSNILIVFVDGVFTYRELTYEEYVTPLYYKLEVEIFNYIGQNSTFSGESRITIRIEKDIKIVGFHSFVSIDGVTLHKISPNNVTITKPYVRDHLVATYKPENVQHFRDIGYVALFFNETIECGYYVIEIKFWERFTKNTEEDGFLVTSYENLKGELQWMVVTQTRVKGPQAIFPCWDNPRFKIVFDVSVRHSNNYTALSNSRIDMFVYDGSDTMSTHFESTSPILAHCIDIVVLPTIYSDFTYVHVNNNVTIWIPKTSISPYPEFDFASNITKNVTKYLNEQNLVDQCKVAKTTYFAVRKFSTAVIATPSFILYREKNITIHDKIYKDRDIYKRKKEINVARLIAQQITYQWILRSTNPLNWTSTWSKEVSNFLAMYILQKVLPEFKVENWLIQSFYLTDSISFSLDLDDVIQFVIDSRINSLCDIYKKEVSVKSFLN